MAFEELDGKQRRHKTLKDETFLFSDTKHAVSFSYGIELYRILLFVFHAGEIYCFLFHIIYYSSSNFLGARQ